MVLLYLRKLIIYQILVNSMVQILEFEIRPRRLLYLVPLFSFYFNTIYVNWNVLALSLTRNLLSLEFQFEMRAGDENLFKFFWNVLMRNGRSASLLAILMSLFNYIKEYATKIPLDFFVTLLLVKKEPPFLISRYQKSNRTYFFPVPFIELSRKRKLFFLFVATPLKQLRREYKQYSFKNIVFAMFLMQLYFPESSYYSKAFSNFVNFGTSNRMYLHYRWRFKK